MRPRTKKYTPKRMKKWKRILQLKNDLRDGLTWDEAENKYGVSRPTIATWKKMKIPDEVLARINETEVEHEIRMRKEEKKKSPLLCKGMNQLEFMESSEGLGFKLFPMQKLIVKAFYGLKMSKSEKIIMAKLKKAGKTTWKKGEKYTELVLMVGMKGGKTELVSAISLAEERELYKLKNPQKYYKLPEGKEIYIINVATEKEQAKDTIFASCETRIKHSKFYQQRNYKPGTYQYEFPDINTYLLSGHSNSASIVGRTAKVVLFDELARFTEKKTGKSSGKKVYNSLNRSVAPFKEDARIISLSSTIHEKDMINDLYELSGKVKGMLGFWLATWEINPNLPFNCSFLQRELAKSPEDFWRDYGCQPARATEKYIRDRLKILKMFNLGMQKGIKNPINDDGTFKDWFKSHPDFNYYLHLDPAVNNCSMGIALSFKKGSNVELPLVHRFIAKANKEIDFEEVKTFLGVLLDRFPNIKKASFDSYIAVSLSQFLEKRGVLCEFLSIQKKQYDLFKIDGLYREKIATYPNKVLERELKDLDLINGKTVDHPEDGSKDESDAAAGAVSHALAEEDVEIGMSEVDSDTKVEKEKVEKGMTSMGERKGLIW